MSKASDSKKECIPSDSKNNGSEVESANFMNADLHVQSAAFSSDALDEAAKARMAEDLKLVQALREKYVEMVQKGEIIVAEGDWIAIYDKNKFKVAKTPAEVLKGITYPCYSVQHRADLKITPIFIA